MGQPAPVCLGWAPLDGDGPITIEIGRRGLSIATHAADALRAHQQGDLDDEACGVLIGTESAAGGVTVERATAPGPLDVRTRGGCQRADPSHQEAVLLAWARSRGTSIYLGNWHTHPQAGTPYPSVVDCEEWIRDAADIRSQPGYTPRRLVYLIVGAERVVAWEVVT